MQGWPNERNIVDKRMQHGCVQRCCTMLHSFGQGFWRIRMTFRRSTVDLGLTSRENRAAALLEKCRTPVGDWSQAFSNQRRREINQALFHKDLASSQTNYLYTRTNLAHREPLKRLRCEILTAYEILTFTMSLTSEATMIFSNLNCSSFSNTAWGFGKKNALHFQA